MSKFLPFRFVLLISLILSSSAQGNKCLGLVLQGEGDKGAYHAGVLSGLVKALGPEATQYDVVSAISIGAINAAWISQYAKGQEQEMTDKLLDFWLNLQAKDIYKQWLGGIVQGLLLEPSIYNTEPAEAFFKATFSQIPKRFISLGATDIDTAEYHTFNNFYGDLAPEEFIEVIMASLAIPGVFPYVEIDGIAFIDGGAVMGVDVEGAVTKCREITGGVDEDIYLDVILLTGSHYKPTDASSFNGIQMLMRAIELMSYHTSLSGLIQAKDSYPNVNFRYVVQPDKSLPDSTLPMHFNHKHIVKMIDTGIEDAEQVVAKGPGVAFEEAVAAARATVFKEAKYEQANLMRKYAEELEKLMNEKVNLVE